MTCTDASEVFPSTLREGDEFSFPFSVDAEAMKAFAELSGDRHPLHVDAAYAESRGFEGTVVYGALLVAQVSRLIGMEIGVPHCVWNSLRIEFRSPLYVGQDARLTAHVASLSSSVNIAQLKFKVEAGHRTIATGSADVMVYT